MSLFFAYEPDDILMSDEFGEWVKAALDEFFEQKTREGDSPEQTLDEWIEDFGALLGKVQRGEP